MLSNLFKIFLNANKAIYINNVNRKKILELIFLYLFLISAASFLVYFNLEKFISDSKIIANLLSLFSGLMFSVLLKIPDKLKDLKQDVITETTSLPEREEIERKNTEKTSVYNYLKNFMFTLTYSIIIAVICILLVILSTFFCSLTDKDLSYLNTGISQIKMIDGIIILYRFLFAFFIIKFIIFVLYAVRYLYNFSIYEFNQYK